jgi:cytochrome d ubiquinol oxidase subunit II
MINCDLNSLWFLIIAFLWIGYFFLEGFDFGVGILLPLIGKDDLDRRLLVTSIGPLWDGNEVWLIFAGGATFAAFPEWYATLFSAFYLPLFLILIALILRGVALEFRAKDRRPEWRAWWDRAIVLGSVLPAFLWGVAFAGILRGVPIDIDGEFSGNLLDLLSPFALLGGLTTLVLFTLHGAVFITLKTEGEITERARRAASRLAVPAALLVTAFLGWAWGDRLGLDGVTADLLPAGEVLGFAIAAAAAAGLSVVLTRRQMWAWAFAATGLAIVLAVATIFVALYPRVMPSSVEPASRTLDVYNASSSPTTLRLMSWLTLVFFPIVLAYQAWSYWVFRKRISRERLSTGAA